MRFTLAAVVLSGVLSTAYAGALQSRQSTFPSCALTCVTNPPDLFGCDATDNSCLCSSQQYVAATTTCITGACDADDAASAEALSRELCAQVGVTLTSTPASGPTSSAGDSSAAPSSTGSGSAPAASSTAPAASSGAGASSHSSPAASGSSSSTSAAPSTTQSGAAAATGANALLGAAALVLAAFNL